MGSLVSVAEFALAPVSVIIPCYRCSDTIERALESIRCQTMLPSEVLLVEDVSADAGKTIDKLHELVDGHDGEMGMSIRILCMESNGGPGEARNLGWANASQPYIAFLDADDAWHPQKIEIQYLWMKAHPEVTLSCHETIVHSNCERDLSLPVECLLAHPISALRMLFINMIPTRTVMLQASVVDRFAEGMRYAEDYHLWLRILLSNLVVYRLRLPMAFSFKSEFSDAGLSGNTRAMHQGEIMAFNTLLATGHISYPIFVFASSFARIKFWRRGLIVFFGLCSAKGGS
jgi:glycosyltransferase involved in cell wall biosynthesis